MDGEEAESRIRAGSFGQLEINLGRHDADSADSQGCCHRKVRLWHVCRVRIQQIRLTLLSSRQMSASPAASIKFDDTETLTSEKAQLNTLIVEQQLSLCKVVDLYAEYQASETETASDDKAMVSAKERVGSIITEMKPDSLELYQENSLEQIYTSSVESERVAAVLKIASPYADRLMKQWTVVDRPEAHYDFHSNLPGQSGKPSLRRIASQPDRPETITSRNAYLKARSPFYQNPSVESDSEDDALSSKFSTQSTVRPLLNN